MEQVRTRMTAAIGGLFPKSVCWALFSLFFSGVAVAEPTLPELINQGRQSRSIQYREYEGMPRNDQSAANKATTVVFVSYAIPKNELVRLLEQGSGKDDVLFVFRGFPNGNGKETIALIKEIGLKMMKANKKMPHIMVYPQAFRAYNIQQVPAVLHKNQDGAWYLAQGGLNINNAIVAIERHQYKMPLSRQWKVSEPDQAEYFREQTKKIAQENYEKWDEHAAELVQKKIQGEMTLPYAQKTATDTFTPYYTVPEDVIDPKSKKVLIQKGTKINILGSDTQNGGTILVVDGRDDWQVNFAGEVMKKDPETVLFYTQRGKLQDGLPLDKGIAERLYVSVVPTLLIKKGNQFERRIYKRK
ncbi:MAG: hypothetical protein IJ143_08560 [Neisseriaceae bacterium]|nr:hypothetical protein [Neisseriaceae bacterium]